MSITSRRAEDILLAALALPVMERDDFLARSCGGDRATVERVRALIEGYEMHSAFLESPAAEEPLPAEPRPGEQIGPYRLVEKIGEGGFGVVFLAEQTAPVRRRVALKLIRLGLDTREFIARFAVERQALALMEHPNIARVFDAGATERGRPYLVMEFIAGQPVTHFCDEQRLSLRARLELFLEICGAIQHAHQKGVIHRDLKPSNILVASEGGRAMPKLIDFGIAKATRERLGEHPVVTQQLALIGTPAYTSPEQMEVDGRAVDTRSDIYSLGALLYELLAGLPLFDRDVLKRASFDELRRTIREAEPPRPSVRVGARPPAQRDEIAARRGVSPDKLVAHLRTDLDWIVMRCLEKDPARRYETAATLAADVRRHLKNEPVAARPPGTAYRLGKFFRRHRSGVFAGLAIVGVAAAGLLVTTLQTRRAWRAERAQEELRLAAQRAEQAVAAQAQRLEKIRWARDTLLPEINRLMKRNDIVQAFALAKQVEEFLPDDPALASLWPLISATVAVETTPAGADIYAKPYDRPAAEWQYLGKSPLQDVQLPRVVHRWRIEQEGHVPVEKADGWFWPFTGRRVGCTLYPKEANPAGMVHVELKDSPPMLDKPPANLADFWIDQHEVTNREFMAFVAGGGYLTEKFWKQSFVGDGSTLSWADAMALFRDRTGQPGPAGWSDGTYPEGQADYPVTGVNWFEAAAYAEFAGKRLPSVAHWQAAARRSEAEYLLAFANCSSDGPARVGASQGITWCGAVDMAGNAKEWCWNETSGGGRFLLGGGWAEADYMFTQREPCSPFDRGAQNGFRCIKTEAPQAGSKGVDGPIPPENVRDYAAERPVSDEKYEAIKQRYAYDKAPLDSRLEGVAVEGPRWRRERVSFNAAYRGERVEALIFFPRSARPPYQALIYFPGTGARLQNAIESARDMPVVEALLHTGRAVVYPVLEGTYERRLSPQDAPRGVVERSELWIRMVQDARRTVDYLETRTDFEPGATAFAGLSLGAVMGPIVCAVDDRFKANVFLSGAFLGRKEQEVTDPFTFAPRVTQPTLMINGRQDFIYPLETSQRPLFDALGTPAEHKRLRLVGASHFFPVAQVTSDIREWLDRYLGPVSEAAGK
jgi:serine/threonine protein kinase/formylglycine-generating enzyme required for sulfatase activity/dienelactone hydrolase/type II secretory pathway pseudopilin PulG